VPHTITVRFLKSVETLIRWLPACPIRTTFVMLESLIPTWLQRSQTRNVVSACVSRMSTSPTFTLVSCSDYSSVCSSETSVDFQRTTRRLFPHDRGKSVLTYSLTNLSPYPPRYLLEKFSSHRQNAACFVTINLGPFPAYHFVLQPVILGTKIKLYAFSASKCYSL
jgi:hypothetical protein